MQETDIFENLYLKLLAKRLVHQMSISIEYEKLMVSYLQVNFHRETLFSVTFIFSLGCLWIFIYIQIEANVSRY